MGLGGLVGPAAAGHLKDNFDEFRIGQAGHHKENFDEFRLGLGRAPFLNSTLRLVIQKERNRFMCFFGHVIEKKCSSN